MALVGEIIDPINSATLGIVSIAQFPFLADFSNGEDGGASVYSQSGRLAFLVTAASTPHLLVADIDPPTWIPRKRDTVTVGTTSPWDSPTVLRTALDYELDLARTNLLAVALLTEPIALDVLTGLSEAEIKKLRGFVAFPDAPKLFAEKYLVAR